MTSCEFFLAVTPPTATHQQKKVANVGGRLHFYEPPRLKAARELLTLHLSAHRPKEPFSGPVRLCVRWCFPKGRHRAGWKTTRPDTDNLQKLLKDVMTDVGFWRDDAVVCVEHVEKVWGERVGIFIRVEEL